MFDASGMFVFVFLIRMKLTRTDNSFTSRKLYDINNDVARGEIDGNCVM